MPGLIGKLAALAATPQGRRAMQKATRKAQEIASDPKNRAKVEQVRARVQEQVQAQAAKRRGPGGTGGGSGAGPGPQGPAGGPPATT